MGWGEDGPDRLQAGAKAALAAGALAQLLALENFSKEEAEATSGVHQNLLMRGTGVQGATHAKGPEEEHDANSRAKVLTPKSWPKGTRYHEQEAT